MESTFSHTHNASSAFKGDGVIALIKIEKLGIVGLT
jgi:hypothetical protein